MNREAHKQFASEKFRWLEQIALDGELSALAVRIAIWLCHLFNLEHGGAAWPYQDSIAAALGVKRKHTNKAITALVKRGHLTSERRGRDKPNHYRFVLQNDADQGDDVRDHTHHDASPEAHHPNYDAPPGALRCASRGAQTPYARRPRQRGAGAPAGSAGQQVVLASKIDGAGASDGECDQLRALWQRGWSKDATTKQRAADRKAYAEARRHATPKEIFAGAKVWLKGIDAPCYLPVLSDWLAACHWKNKPPKKGKRHAGNGARRGKVDLTELLYLQNGVWRYDDDGNIINSETGKIVRSMQ
jgi:hypothetical protein